MARVTLLGVSKAFGPVKAVDDLTLDVADGEFMALLGPSGSGKTTVLRLIAGLEEPDRGDVLIGDRRVNGLEPRARGVAFVFQSYALYPHLTAHDNIAYPLRLRGVPEQEQQRRVFGVAALLRIRQLLGRRPAQLSGGQRQRVAVGRAIVTRPQVFLMDEPLSNLDAKLRFQTRAEIKRLQRSLGATTLYVTHDQAEAMTMADRVALIDQGVLQQVGTPAGVYAQPASTFVAGFVGSPPMNLIPCRLVEADGRAWLQAETFRLDLDDLPVLRAAATRAELVLGIRPEDLQVLSDPAAAGALPARTLLAERLGAENVVSFELGRQVIAARTPPEVSPAVGAPVALRPNRERLHLFDGVTGRRLV